MKINKSLQTKITVQICIILTVMCSSIVYFSIERSYSLFFDESHQSNVIDTLQTSNTSEDAAIITETSKDIFDIQLVLFSIFVTGLGTLTVYLTSKKTLQPLQTVISDINEIDERMLSKRIRSFTHNKEANLISQNFNNLMDRIETVLLNQQSFSSNVAHELKTPLSIMKTSIQTSETRFRESGIDPAIFLDNIDRLTKIINDLLLVSKSQQFAEDDKELINLEVLFETILDELLPIYLDLNLEIDIDLEINSIYEHFISTYRVFFNLVENALNYNNSNGFIKIRSFESKESIVVSIENSSQQIEDTELDSYFNPLFRSQNSIDNEIKGTGLGLSIVESMIRNQGGSIYFRNHNNTSIEFFVEFPRKI